MTGQEARDDEGCTHGSYYLDEEGNRHCLTCADVRPLPQEARDDEREALVRDLTAADAWRAIVEMNAPTLAAILRVDGYRKHPEPEITAGMVDRARAAQLAWQVAPENLWESTQGGMRAALEAAIRVPVGEGETDGAR